MKTNIDGVLLVEGKEDVAFLSSFINTLFFTTNGYDINEEKIAFLLEASKVNKLIIFTDPDEAGEKIKNTLKNKISGLFEAEIEKNKRKNYKKNGVAESSKEAVIKALKPFITNEEIKLENYDLVTLVSLGKNPQEIKDKIIQKYHLVKGNNKSIENQLRILKISKEELWKLIDQTSMK